MASTTLTRTGAFDPGKLGTLEQQLVAAGLPTPIQVYGTTTGISCVWPNGLTAPQSVQAQTIINAYLQPTDFQQLPPALQKIHQYSQLPSPTNAQVVQATQLMAKAIVKLYSGKDSIDGVDISN